MSYTFEVPEEPRTKGRPRVTKRGHTYTPKVTKDAEDALASYYDGPTFEGPVEVKVDYWPDRQIITIKPRSVASTMRGDIDNYVKLTLDALQQAEAFSSDRQVQRILASKRVQ